ncbi:hypothetical protein GCM10007094_32120 [Pseudovibrio japonicus]|uniref:Secreted protein n=1 Tax=Pseudovibrio japonicus TaxID=366534 RepID=A0ABQ3EQX6_9HYPH|nr:hypothetical protein [Pseudovibrio japonicus]GHB40367.1 hypothetical protein GCM10007094_32120 [Pseudovibrio japonicus]
MRFFKHTIFAINLLKNRRTRAAYCWLTTVFSVICVVLNLHWTPAHASSQESEQIFNEQNLFDEQEKCNTHLEFLEGKDTALPEECHSIATFQIESHHLKDIDYLTRMYALAGEDTSLGALALAVQAAVLKVRPVLVYSHAEIADRRVSISMGQSSDIERAVLYSHLLSQVKRIALLSMCKKNANCELIPDFLTIQKSFGAEYSYVDELDPSFTLTCLLRLDSYLTPVRGVLSSIRFKECLVSRGNLLQN